jgi:hypothetical protein
MPPLAGFPRSNRAACRLLINRSSEEMILNAGFFLAILH